LPADDVTGWLSEIQRLREHVRVATEALASRRAVPEADIQALQDALSAPAGSLRLVDPDSTPPRLSRATDATNSVLVRCQIALLLALFLRSPQRHRLKLCANPTCGFAFVDTSINASRRWCFMRYCGNRLKVRAFRGRQSRGRRAR
jgi:predicted RNA-binding Zn ribbon-like protein